MASGGSSEEAQLAQCQAYVQRHNIQQLVKEAIVSLCINKPENPILFLKEHFEKLYDQRSQACSLKFHIKIYGLRTVGKRKVVYLWQVFNN
ncbi:unnamed protein product [Cercopithifilaria johnstoni]|uniref:RIIa domain-containing protein n=1 Tax=Cercopithifilaria johnstoni TaxID=2874296 RepID=A0A8J2MDY5_9BILA|nr:unnamed protein product [Cercopithifilaria johnstoni]